MTPKEYLSRYRWLDAEINAKREQCEEAIGAVPEQRLRTLLELRYVNCLTLEETAARMNYSYSQICRLHRRALRKIKMI